MESSIPSANKFHSLSLETISLTLNSYSIRISEIFSRIWLGNLDCLGRRISSVDWFYLLLLMQLCNWILVSDGLFCSVMECGKCKCQSKPHCKLQRHFLNQQKLQCTANICARHVNRWPNTRRVSILFLSIQSKKVNVVNIFPNKKARLETQSKLFKLIYCWRDSVESFSASFLSAMFWSRKKPSIELLEGLTGKTGEE